MSTTARLWAFRAKGLRPPIPRSWSRFVARLRRPVSNSRPRTTAALSCDSGSPRRPLDERRTPSSPQGHATPAGKDFVTLAPYRERESHAASVNRSPSLMEVSATSSRASAAAKSSDGDHHIFKTEIFGGRGGIRTHGRLAPTAVFKTAALNHSATLPYITVLGH